MKGAELVDIGEYCVHEGNFKSLNKCNALTLLYQFLSKPMSGNLCRGSFRSQPASQLVFRGQKAVTQSTLKHNCSKTMLPVETVIYGILCIMAA